MTKNLFYNSNTKMSRAFQVNLPFHLIVCIGRSFFFCFFFVVAQLNLIKNNNKMPTVKYISTTLEPNAKKKKKSIRIHSNNRKSTMKNHLAGLKCTHESRTVDGKHPYLKLQLSPYNVCCGCCRI